MATTAIAGSAARRNESGEITADRLRLAVDRPRRDRGLGQNGLFMPGPQEQPPSGTTNPIEFFDMAASWPHRSFNLDRPLRIRLFIADSGPFHTIADSGPLNLHAFQRCSCA